MNKNRYNELLKEVFQNEKSKKMDWSFDNFLLQIPENQPKQSFLFKKIIYWAAAASVLLIIGLFFTAKPKIEKQKPQIFSIYNNSELKTKKLSQDVFVNQDFNKNQSKTVNRKPLINDNSPVISEQSENKEAEIEIKYQPEYVTINGEPVSDEQKADSITRQALMFFAQNFEHSTDGIEILNQNIKSVNNLIINILKL